MKRILEAMLAYPLVGLFYLAIWIDDLSYLWLKTYYTVRKIPFYEQRGKFSKYTIKVTD